MAAWSEPVECENARCLLAAIAVSFGVSQPGLACTLSEAQKGTVAQVIDGETLALTDGSVVRLIGAKTPAPPLGWRGEHPWPKVEAVRLDLGPVLAGMRMRVRGWIEWRKGPMIHATHPEQIELVPPASGPQSAPKPEPSGVAL